MHVFGILFLFLAAVLPLSLWSVTLFGIETSAATIAVIPVVIYWFLLDAALGAGILAAAVALLSAAALIVGQVTPLAMWSLTAVLIVVGVASQIIGHRVFEGRQPALVDNPTHLLLGPMFVMAKLFIALGFRRDLAEHYRAASAKLIVIFSIISARTASPRMTRILVTGGNGFIGKHLVSALVAQEREVRVLDLQPPFRALPKVEHVRGSVLDRDLVQRAMEGVDEVYHLAGLPGMWLPRKGDFHAVNYGGTETVIETARKRGVKRFLHCSTESILFRASRSNDLPAEDALRPDDMPGPYTRSKMLAERYAMQAAATGYPVVIGCPTMPIGPHDHNVTPPTAMLRHFLSPRLQLYLDFVVNLVDVRDVAAGLILAMERGQAGHRYILGGEGIALKQVLRIMADISGRRAPRLPINGRLAEIAATLHGIRCRSSDPPASVRYRRRGPDRIAGGGAVDRKGATRAWLRPKSCRARAARNHCASAWRRSQSA